MAVKPGRLQQIFGDHVHDVLLVFWLLMIIPTLVWWKDSILWVAIMSLYANIETSAAAREARNGGR